MAQLLKLLDYMKSIRRKWQLRNLNSINLNQQIWYKCRMLSKGSWVPKERYAKMYTHLVLD